MRSEAQESVTKIHRGLAGIHVDRSQVSMIDGKEGRLSYRGYSIEDLVEHSSFEETAYLLIYGRLPTRRELAMFDAELRSWRTLPSPALDLIASIADTHPMDVLRSVVSMLAAFDPDRSDNSAEAIKRKAVRLISQCATAVAAHDALRHGRQLVLPDIKLGHTANLLYMLHGTTPDPEMARIFDQDFVIHAEHGSNASAFAGRVVAGAGADFHADITAAVACFAGASHGGAVEGVMRMVREIGEPERVKDYVAARHKRRDPVMGFGHRVYRTADPRARYLREHAETLGRRRGEMKLIEILDNVIHEMEPYRRHGVDVNVDFFAAISYRLLDIADDLFGAVFALSRLAGWTAQILEQNENNILIRPLLLYVGDLDKSYIPVEER